MRRVLAIAVVLGATALLVVLLGGRGDDARGDEFALELDNAFGLVTGGDFKVAGVTAGQLTTIDLDRATNRARVGFRITEDGFGSLRADVSCEVAPQSLVGEYYVDCTPGRSRRRLAAGTVIPVERTTTVVAPDLVGNIQRLPVRERLRLVINELGAAVAGNARNINAALRRASPALRQTNRVLAILARQNDTLADLTRDADTVLADLAANRTDVSRFVREARDTAVVSASRDDEIAAGLRRLPTFLRELRPTMTRLGRTVDVQGPALQELARSSGALGSFLDRVEPFADANVEALPVLGEAADATRRAVEPTRATVRELDRFTAGAPELARNLRFVLEHLDDRDYAAETDPRSPGGRGYTGLEAFLQYVFDQTLATNTYDSESHILKAFPFEGACAAYADIAAAKEDRERKPADQCGTALGPSSIGFNVRDATAPPGYDGRDRAAAGGEGSALSPDRITGLLPTARAERRRGGAEPAMRMPDADRILPGRPAPSPGRAPAPAPVTALPAVPTPSVPGATAPAAPSTPEADAQGGLLDFLLGD